MVDVYIALGGNQPNTLNTMRQVIAGLKKCRGIAHFAYSRLYQTSPVSSIPQPDYLNAVCRFETQLPLEGLWDTLQNLEREVGKIPKSKESPRLIDIDLLFYGTEVGVFNDLIIPHPKWSERLFVLKPLADVTFKTPLGIDVNEIMKRFGNPHQEQITLSSKGL